MKKQKQLIKSFSEADLRKMTRRRDGEVKLGETISYGGKDWRKDLETSSASFVMLGIAEDIGVRANLGRPGAHSAIRPALASFFNQQENEFLRGENIFVLGEVITEDLMKLAEGMDGHNTRDVEPLRAMVMEIDERVSKVMQAIVETGKIPLVIGGGHNNAYGNICGSARALKTPISVVNCDPHLDFREPAEGRHSGNGFSTAFLDGHLQQYAVLCAHEQYNNDHAIREFRRLPSQLFFESFESVFIREEKDFKAALGNVTGFVKGQGCGIELDLDSITNVPSSARTSSGISALQARQYVHHCAAHLDCIYLHIAEGAPVLSHLKADIKTGKLIAYLLSDFIKATLQRRQAKGI